MISTQLHPQTRDAGNNSAIKAGSKVRCIMFDGTIIDGVVLGSTSFYVTVNVDGLALDFRYEDVSLIQEDMEDFELTARLHSDRFKAQRAYFNQLDQDEELIEADGANLC